MPVTIPERATPAATCSPKPSLWKRIGWFVALYCLGVGSVGLVAYGLRLWIKA
jgi:hypothetical protein